MSRLSTMIGDLVVHGYMATYHEETVYLHNSQGKRWAEIEPFGMTMKLTVDGKDYEAENTSELLSRLETIE